MTSTVAPPNNDKEHSVVSKDAKQKEFLSAGGKAGGLLRPVDWLAVESCDNVAVHKTAVRCGAAWTDGYHSRALDLAVGRRTGCDSGQHHRS